MNPYLCGERLYGEDLDREETDQWFADEKEGYWELLKLYSSYSYVYHALRYEHGFRHLPMKRFDSVLGVGSAYGDEFQ